VERVAGNFVSDDKTPGRRYLSATDRGLHPPAPLRAAEVGWRCRWVGASPGEYRTTLFQP